MEETMMTEKPKKQEKSKKAPAMEKKQKVYKKSQPYVRIAFVGASVDGKKSEVEASDKILSLEEWQAYQEISYDNLPTFISLAEKRRAVYVARERARKATEKADALAASLA